MGSRDLKESIRRMERTIEAEFIILERTGLIDTELSYYASDYYFGVMKDFIYYPEKFFSVTKRDRSSYAVITWGCQVFPVTVLDLIELLHSHGFMVSLALHQTTAVVPPSPLDISELIIAVAPLSQDLSGHYPHLSNLTIHNCWMVGQDTISLDLPSLEQVLISLPKPGEWLREHISKRNSSPSKLRSVDLSRCVSLRACSVLCPHVEEVSLPPSVSDLTISSTSFEKLHLNQTLNLSSLKLEVGRLPQKIFDKLSLENSLTIHTTSYEESFPPTPLPLLNHMRLGGALHSLNFNFLPSLTSLVLEKVYMTRLLIQSCSLSTFSGQELRARVTIVKNCPDLEEISLEGKMRTLSFSNLAELRTLSLVNHTKGVIKISVSRTPKLRKIILQAHSGIIKLTLPDDLNVLHISIPAPPWSSSNEAKKTLIILQGGARLQELSIDCSTPLSIEATPMPLLSELSLIAKGQLSAPGWLSECTSLSSLRLEGTPVKIPDISSLTNLEFINLKNPEILGVPEELPGLMAARLSFTLDCPGTVEEELIRIVRCPQKTIAFSDLDNLKLDLVRHLYVEHWVFSDELLDNLQSQFKSHKDYSSFNVGRGSYMGWLVFTLSMVKQVSWEEVTALASVMSRLMPDSYPLIENATKPPQYFHTRWDLKPVTETWKLVSHSTELELVCTCVPSCRPRDVEWLIPDVLPRDVLDIPVIAYLELSFCKISSLPEEPALDVKMLSLIYNGLEELPQNFFHARRLTEVVLSQNQLSSLPDFPTDSNITRLSVDSNSLVSLPRSIQNLQKLEELDLSGNQLSGLPPELLELPRLAKIHLDSTLRDDPVANQLEEKGVALEFYMYS